VVCAAALAVLMLRSSRRKFLYAGLASVAMVAAVPFLPTTFKERMGTISNHEGDESASTRIEVWKWTLQYAKDHPAGGGFDAYLGNSFTYQVRKAVGTAPNISYEFDEVTDKQRAYHSSYFEMLGEQGWFGLIVWLWLMGLGVWQMERIRWRFAQRKIGPASGPVDGKDTWQWGLATALQQAQLTYLIGAAFVGIAFQPFAFMLVALQCGLWTYVKRTEAAPAAARFTRAPPPVVGLPASA
jgi:O-antigen ligase